MARTTVNIDADLLAGAKDVLHTSGVTETVNAAMAAVVGRARLAGFSVLDFDITDDDLAESRRDHTLPDD